MLLISKDLEKKVVDNFWKLNLIKTPADIFNLDYKKIEKLDGWGNLSISNLKNAINNSKNIVLDKFIFSIGIRHIGQENAKVLANFFKKSKKFSELFDSTKRKEILKNLDDLDGIGETQIKSVEDFFSNKKNSEIIQNLINSLTIKDYEKKIKSGKLSNKKHNVYWWIQKNE